MDSTARSSDATMVNDLLLNGLGSEAVLNRSLNCRERETAPSPCNCHPGDGSALASLQDFVTQAEPLLTKSYSDGSVSGEPGNATVRGDGSFGERLRYLIDADQRWAGRSSSRLNNREAPTDTATASSRKAMRAVSE